MGSFDVQWSKTDCSTEAGLKMSIKIFFKEKKKRLVLAKTPSTAFVAEIHFDLFYISFNV